jgi:hypothetical protein
MHETEILITSHAGSEAKAFDHRNTHIRAYEQVQILSNECERIPL